MTSVPTTPAPNVWKAIVRSLMPWILAGVGLVIAKAGWKPTPDAEVAILTALGGGLTILLHLVETKFPWVGVFLGYIGAPTYAPATKTIVNTQLADALNQIAELQRQVTDLTPKVGA
jgi:hypothetical protein